jgi:IMP dehydrogenase
MKTIRDVMTPNVVWISPAQQAKTAIILMKGHGINALPVIYSHDSVVGVIHCSNLIGQDPNIPVVDIMDKNFTVVQPEMPVFQAADLMKTGAQSHLLVVEAGKLVGIVSRSDVICELGKSYDTLTRLPWQDAFREWCISAFDRGREISIILIDLNLFGKFNKRYGHVMGDNVLKAVAQALDSQIDPERDFLCRYAGDEFAVASYRPAAESNEFGVVLVEAIESIVLPGLPEKIGATFGVAGGRRTGGRSQIHSTSTLDDLITNASLNCTLAKPHRPDTAASETPSSAVDQTPQPEEKCVEKPRLKIQTIRLSTTAAEATAEVILSSGTEEFAYSATGVATGARSTLRLVAESAAASVGKSLPDGYGVAIEDVVRFQTNDDREIVSVIATFITPTSSTTHAGSAVIRRADPYRAAAAALLSATNRLIASIPSAKK